MVFFSYQFTWALFLMCLHNPNHIAVLRETDLLVSVSGMSKFGLFAISLSMRKDPCVMFNAFLAPCHDLFIVGGKNCLKAAPALPTVSLS